MITRTEKDNQELQHILRMAMEATHNETVAEVITAFTLGATQYCYEIGTRQAKEDQDSNWCLPDSVEEFSQVRMVISSHLDNEGVLRASGCLGYALREHLAGEDLSIPVVTYTSEDVLPYTTLIFHYDSTKSRRSDPDFVAAFSAAKDVCREGSPVRKTNRSGPGTKGTRLVEGIGQRSVDFWVR